MSERHDYHIAIHAAPSYIYLINTARGATPRETTMTAQALFSLYDDTGPIWTGTCGEFLADNDDMDPAEVAEIVNSLIETGEARFGGGAGPLFTLRRCTLQPA
jgi:hypothetical protein